MHGQAEFLQIGDYFELIKKLKLEELNRIDLAGYKEQKKFPVVLVLDNIRSALNVGSAFRTCDAFSVDKLFLVGITPVPPHSDITKSAIGATLSVDHEYYPDMASCLNQITKQGYQLVGLEQTTKSEYLPSFIWKKKVAIIVGNEVNGISDDALPQIDRFVDIPQFGTKHSLNVSVALGIVLWDYLKSVLPEEI